MVQKGLPLLWKKIILSLWINELFSDKSVCRTAPATPGLLNKGLNGDVYNEMVKSGPEEGWNKCVVSASSTKDKGID